MFLPDFKIQTGKPVDLREDLPLSPSLIRGHRPEPDDDLFFAHQFIFAYLIAVVKNICIFDRGCEKRSSPRKSQSEKNFRGQLYFPTWSGKTIINFRSF